MNRRPEWIRPRRAIPVATKRAVLARSGGICEREGCKRPGKEFNHKVGVAFNGGDGPDDVELICREHHAPETEDQRERALKADKQGGRCGQYARRKKKGSRLKSRGFATNRDGKFKAKIGGGVERRE